MILCKHPDCKFCQGAKDHPDSFLCGYFFITGKLRGGICDENCEKFQKRSEKNRGWRKSIYLGGSRTAKTG